jgi:RHS repeat-associated protein
MGPGDGVTRTLVESYLFDGIDHPLRIARPGVASTNYDYYEVDLAGNVRGLRASGGASLGGYRYSAFGQTIEDTSLINQPLRWKGRWFSQVAGGTYDVRARQWSPELGVFLSVDEFRHLSRSNPLWGWPGQNPIRYRDPTGRLAPSAGIVIAAGVAGGSILGPLGIGLGFAALGLASAAFPSSPAGPGTGTGPGVGSGGGLGPAPGGGAGPGGDSGGGPAPAPGAGGGGGPPEDCTLVNMLPGIVPECIYECGDPPTFAFKIDGVPLATSYCEPTAPRPSDPGSCR